MRRAQWVVVLEAAAQSSEGVMDERQLQRLLGAFPDGQPVGLHSPKRYAVQLQVEADGETEALGFAVAQWRAAVKRLGTDNPRLIRAEVLTREEFEEDCRRVYDREDEGGDTWGSDDELSAGRLADRLLQQVFHDPLTQLPARGLFMSHLEQGLVGRQPGDTLPVLGILKLSGLGLVNERLGRAAGDAVLATIARRLKARLPQKCLAARISGVEFAVLLEEVSGSEAVQLLLGALDGLGDCGLVGDTEVSVSTSVGVAVARRGAGAEELLTDGRTAASAAGRTSRRLEIFRPGLPAAEGLRARPGVVDDPLGYLLLLQRAAMASNEASCLQRAAGLVASHVCAHVGWQVGHLYVVVQGGRLAPGGFARPTSGHHEALVDFLGSLTLGPGEGLAGRVVETGQPAWVSDVGREPSMPWGSIATRCGLHAALAFPVLVGREVAAVLEFYAEQAPPPDDTLIEVLCAVGSQLGRVIERRRGQASLRASEDRLREAQALAQLGSWHVDVPRELCSWTPELCDILGVAHDAPHTFDSFLELVHPDDRPRARAEMKTACTTGATGPFGLRIARPDGQQRWVSVRVSSTRDDSGGISSIYGTMFDVTHVEVADQAVRERERKLNIAEQVAQMGSWERDVATDGLLWSDGMFRLWGVERHEFRPNIDALLAATHPDDRERVRRILAWAPEARDCATDFRATSPHGHERWFRSRATAEHDGAGRPLRIVGTIQDVTREKLAHRALQASEQRYRKIAETTRDGVWVIDASATTTYVNERMATMLGWTPEEMIGTDLFAYLDEEAGTAFRSRESRRHAGASEQFETTVLRRDGSPMTVFVAASRLNDEHGSYLGSLALINDVSARNRS